MKQPSLVSVHNTTRHVVLAGQVVQARSFWLRLRGLLGRAELPPDAGLIISPCNMVHMWGMQFAIDVVYISKENVVLACVTGLRPWAVGPYVRQAAWVLELQVGKLAASGTKVGDTIEIGRLIGPESLPNG